MANKPLKILFDANPMVIGKKSGVGYYTYQLVDALARSDKHIELVGHYFDFLGRRSQLDLPTGPNIRYVRSKILPGKILSLTRRFGFQPPLEIFFKTRGDIALFTNFVCLPSLTRIPRAIAVHDLCYIDIPEYVAEKNRHFLQKFVPISLRKASIVITISEFTKQTIINHYPFYKGPIMTTPIPPPAPVNSVYDLGNIGVSKKFILSISTLEPRKNFINLVKAYERLPDRIRNSYQLVIAGGKGWYMEETLAYISELQAKGLDIITPGYISDDCRAALYSNASLYAISSHYEGFGMPILEAMSYGLPIAASDIAVHREVARDAAIYFDKDDPDSIAVTIKKGLENDVLRAKLIKSGSKRLKDFSWEDIAQNVIEELQDTLK